LYKFIHIHELPTDFRYHQKTGPKVQPGVTGRLFKGISQRTGFTSSNVCSAGHISTRKR